VRRGSVPRWALGRASDQVSPSLRVFPFPQVLRLCQVTLFCVIPHVRTRTVGGPRGALSFPLLYIFPFSSLPPLFFLFDAYGPFLFPILRPTWTYLNPLRLLSFTDAASPSPPIASEYLSPSFFPDPPVCPDEAVSALKMNIPSCSAFFPTFSSPSAGGTRSTADEYTAYYGVPLHVPFPLFPRLTRLFRPKPSRFFHMKLALRLFFIRPALKIVVNEFAPLEEASFPDVDPSFVPSLRNKSWFLVFKSSVLTPKNGAEQKFSSHCK